MHLFRPLFRALVRPWAVMAVLSAAPALAAAPNDIIWDTPRDAAAPQPAAPDQEGIVWNAPPRKPAPPAASSERFVQAPVATQTTPAKPTTTGPCHEFQTTILIEGRQQPAHGTVCQQADGTWRVVDK